MGWHYGASAYWFSLLSLLRINKVSFSGRSILQAEELGSETKGKNKFGLSGLK